jgi:uncharacterized protein YjdB
MPYLFKLTRRLAHSRSLTILVAALAACSTGDRSITAPDGTSTLQRSVSTSTTVAKVTVSPSSATGTLGQSAQFTAAATNSSGGAVSAIAAWSSTDSTVVAITPAGFATAVGVGSATLTATVNGVRGTAAVTVTGDPIASITISPTSASGSVGQTAVFGATLYDAAGTVLTGRRVLFTTSNASVVTVDSTGLAKGVGNGSATVTAVSGGKSAAAAVTVGGGTQTVTNPGAVTDLAIASIADTTASLSFTQVNDGTGQPAQYEIRYAIAPISWGTAAAAAKGTCTTPLAGTTIGAKLTCTINGLTASSAYNFQIVAFRGTLNVNAVFGALSNPLAASTIAPVPSQPTVGSVSVTPGSASGSVGQGAQFSATVKDANGNTMTGQAVTWSSTNNSVVSVTSAGYATAMGGGTAAIVASAGGKSGQAAITVTGGTSGGTVASATVSPSSATLAVGATKQLSVSLKDLLGNILTGLTTTWTSSNPAVAAVNGSGMVTGVSAGSATVTATSGGVSSSASISISSSSTAPPPSFAGWANAPSSYPLISENPFNALDVLSWRTSWNDAGLLTVSVDPAAPVSPSNVLQFSYPIGFVGSKAPAMEYIDFPLVTHLYSGISWKANANWQTNSSNVNKIEFAYMDQGSGDVYLCFYGPQGGPYDLRAALEFTNGDTRDFLVPNVNNVPVVLGQYHQIEWQIEYNTTTNPANGTMRWWMDGKLIGQYTDIQFPNTKIIEYQISPTWGGMPDVKTQNDFFWYDHVIVKGF